MNASEDGMDELSGLRSQHALGLLDSPPEAALDALMRTAAALCAVPVSMISLDDRDRHWFKANNGLPGKIASARELASCNHTGAHGGLFEVEHAASHPLCANNPLVTGENRYGFYAGAPIRLADGALVGVLCVVDDTPCRLNAEQREGLIQLALAAAQALEGRHAMLEAQRVAELLAKSEARFRTLSEHAPLGVFHSDAEGRGTYTNPRWQEIFGLTLEQSLGQGWTQSLHPADKDAVFRAWESAAEGGHDFDMTYRIVRPDNAVRTIRGRARAVCEPSGAIGGYVGSVEDVTRSKQLASFLAHTGRLAEVGGWELDLGTNALTWSEQTRRIHEVPPDYVPTVEQGIAFYGPEGRNAIAQAVQAGIDQGMPWDLELPLITAKGRSIWVRAQGEVEFEGGVPVRLVGAIKDITERRKRNLALQEEHTLRLQVEHHAAETERLLAERSQMLDILAHEVRQPLNNASAALQSAAGFLASVNDHPVSPRLSRAQAVLSQVVGSIDNTLAVAALLARPDPIERVDSDIDALLEIAIADFPLPERLRIRIQRDTSLRTASMDTSLMRLAIRNLLSNALRHTPPESPVWVQLADSDEPLALLFDISDQGRGVPAEKVPRLFERGANRGADDAVGDGQRVPRSSSAQGLGLGLYIVRRVMELHGGTARVVSNTAAGLTIRLTLVQPSGD